MFSCLLLESLEVLDDPAVDGVEILVGGRQLRALDQRSHRESTVRSREVGNGNILLLDRRLVGLREKMN